MKEGIKVIVNRKKSQAAPTILLVILVIMYIFENYPSEFMRSSNFIYVYKPLIWIIIAVIALVLSRKSFIKHKHIGLKPLLMWWTVLIASVYILINIFMGLLLGFGRSPYNHSLSGIVINLIIAFSPLIGRELARNYFINKYAYKKSKLVIVIVAILFTLLNARFTFNDIAYLGSGVFLELSNNLLASYLVYIGGPILSIIYLGLVESFYYLFPILPDISMAIYGVVGTLYPLVSITIIKYISSFQGKEQITNSEGKKKSSWILTIIISVSLVWFSAGAFPIRPMVIATGSMEPDICAGDVVLTKRVKTSILRKGDIIQFKRGSMYIFHRIIDIVEDGGGKKYKTKGDNNPVPDTELVNAEDIKGKVIYTLPKIGRPTLVLRQH